MEQPHIAVRMLVEVLTEDTEFVMEHLPKSTMAGKTEEEIRENVYPILKKYYDFDVKEDDIKYLPFEASKVPGLNKKLIVFLEHDGFRISSEHIAQFSDSVTSMVTVYYFTRIKEILMKRREGDELLRDEELYLLVKWIEAMNLHIYLEEDNEETRHALQLYLIKTIAHLSYTLIKRAIPELAKIRDSSLILIGIEIDYRENCFWVVYIETKDLEKYLKD